jgi:DNA-binding IclR family transcriptional regulator
MYSIGIAYLDNHVLVQASRALLGPVAEASGGIVQVAEREGRTSIVLAHVEPRIAYGGVGRRLPLHIGARGQVLLAFAGAEFIEEYVSQPLEPVGENSITDRAELLEVLQKVREQDHVVSTREINALRVGVAAPVRNADDEVIAAAAIIRSSDDGVLPEPATRQVIDLARSLSIYAGWRID